MYNIMKDYHNIITTTEEKQKLWVDEYGWYIHYVIETGHRLVDAHTHNVPESFNHMNFQIVFDLGEDLVMYIFSNLIDRIKKGETFSPGEKVSGIIKTYDVKIVEVDADGEKLLRLIFPDVNGLYPDDEKCDEKLKFQMEV